MPFQYVDIFEDVPLRLKSSVNPYVQRLVQIQADQSLPLIFGSQLRSMKGRWREYFSEKMGRPIDRLILEIGIHKGHVLESLTHDLPNSGIIGMDITMKRVVLSAERLQNAGLDNGLVVLGNAKCLLQIFEERELDGVLIFFPDPWTKKAHQIQKRLINESFSQGLASILKKDGFFWFKTDCEDYFKQGLEHFKRLGFEGAGKAPFEKTYESVFERRFKAKNQVTFEETLYNRQVP
jgi:tRNA (guanine-N7-)-methyltransferase